MCLSVPAHVYTRETRIDPKFTQFSARSLGTNLFSRPRAVLQSRPTLGAHEVKPWEEVQSSPVFPKRAAPKKSTADATEREQSEGVDDPPRVLPIFSFLCIILRLFSLIGFAL